ncbi:hypothetical protein PPERSA_10167 [Pseudocohnilembus persalinus]|uniref:Pyrroline-5-carboxylate reductase catalytic N-terminal domain-containing protein n=1 Tax=Pseudocohnilembus persalinus TaxID=266149 RepID=A0A0V0QLG0_PSEPJ|nr:hypothetical protein PPERSA_10167 [Pseudocohnilembus persalinus]|eukprot:KRX03086.1 hypothetical protein PPERSA_10167 [Pseudocohnilembus persalinus]
MSQNQLNLKLSPKANSEFVKILNSIEDNNKLNNEINPNNYKYDFNQNLKNQFDPYIYPDNLYTYLHLMDYSSIENSCLEENLYNEMLQLRLTRQVIVSQCVFYFMKYLENLKAKYHTKDDEFQQKLKGLKIGIIGGGIIGRLILNSLLTLTEKIPISNIHLSTRRPEQLSKYEQMGANIYFDNEADYSKIQEISINLKEKYDIKKDEVADMEKKDDHDHLTNQLSNQIFQNPEQIYHTLKVMGNIFQEPKPQLTQEQKLQILQQLQKQQAQNSKKSKKKTQLMDQGLKSSGNMQNSRNLDNSKVNFSPENLALAQSIQLNLNNLNNNDDLKNQNQPFKPFQYEDLQQNIKLAVLGKQFQELDLENFFKFYSNKEKNQTNQISLCHSQQKSQQLDNSGINKNGININIKNQLGNIPSINVIQEHEQENNNESIINKSVDEKKLEQNVTSNVSLDNSQKFEDQIMQEEIKKIQM